MPRRNLDLWAIVALAVAGLAVQLGPVPLAAKIAGGVPLVLLCPGYALAAALFPGRSLGRPERALIIVGLSLAMAILGAVALNWLVWGLEPVAWAVLFLVVTLAASLAAVLMRRRAGTEPDGVRLPGLKFKFEHWALLGLAGLLTVAAVTLARLPGPVTDTVGYSLLWLTPDAALPTRGVSLGVNSSELSLTHYRLTVQLDGELLLDEPALALAPGQKWEQHIDLPQAQPGGVVGAALYRQDQPGTIYRQVSIVLP